MHRRPANTVKIIERRLTQAELGDVETMELVGLQDELARLERKWRMQLAAGSERRKPGDIDKLNAWFDRLQRLAERLQRSSSGETDLRVLERLLQDIRSRERA